MGGEPERAQANAALIASAPELLEALRLCLPLAERLYRTFPDDGQEQDYYRPLLDAARAAIAKAEG